MASVEKIQDLLTYGGNDRLVKWTDYLEEKSKNKSALVQIDLGFPELNSILDGVIPGEVVVISGLTGNGKTLFAKSLIRNLALDSVPSIAFSYEVTTEEFLRPFREEGLDRAIFYVPMELKTGSLPWIEDRIVEGRLKHNNRVVMIDHLHYVIDMRLEKMSQNIGAAMRRLKEIAVKHEQVILLIAHQEKLKDDKEPGIDTLRDSSFVGQEADIVVIVHRLPDSKPERGFDPTYDLGYALVKVDKSRRSGAFKKRLTFQKDMGWLKPI